MTRPDTYVLELNLVKVNLKTQIMHCKRTLDLLIKVKNDVNYIEAATVLEKANIDNLITLITGGLAQLESIVWE
jgi:hypothetical protein